MTATKSASDIPASSSPGLETPANSPPVSKPCVAPINAVNDTTVERDSFKSAATSAPAIRNEKPVDQPNIDPLGNFIPTRAPASHATGSTARIHRPARGPRMAANRASAMMMVSSAGESAKCPIPS